MFVSFGGKKFDDSPKYMYESMLKDPYWKDFDMIWAFKNPHDFPRVKKSVRIDSFLYFLTALSSRVWVTNSAIERGLNFKKKGTLYFNTWHGTPLKKMGSDKDHVQGVVLETNLSSADAVTVQSEIENEVFTESMGARHSSIQRFGLPRNDALTIPNSRVENKIRINFGLANGDKVILYAPTYRDYVMDSHKNFTDAGFELMKKLLALLPMEYKVLYRAHYVVADKENEYSNRIIDVTNFPNLNELIQASDALITDYSSIMFDYSLTEKPIVVFPYDYDEYVDKRGFYFDIENELLSSRDVGGIAHILRYDLADARRKTVAFKKKYVLYSGHATEKAIEFIRNNI